MVDPANFDPNGLIKPVDAIMLAFVLVSTVIYVIFLLVIIKNRAQEPFSSSYFRICISLGVADLAMIIHCYVFVKAPGWSWGHQFWTTYGRKGSLLALYGNAMIFAFGLAQHIGVFLIALNRFTAIAAPLKHERIWRKRNLLVAFAVQWLLPVVFVAPMIQTDCQYSYWFARDDIGEDSQYSWNVNIEFSDFDYEFAYYAAALLINVTTNLSTLAIYIAVLATVMRSSRLRDRHQPPRSVSLNTRQPQQSDQPPSSSMYSAVAVEENDKKNCYLLMIKGKFWTYISDCLSAIFDFNSSSTSTPTITVNGTDEQVSIMRKATAYHTELRLAVSGFVMFLSMSVYCIFLLAVILSVAGYLDSVDVGYASFYTLWNVSSDVFGCLAPYTILLMSGKTRLEFARFVKGIFGY